MPRNTCSASSTYSLKGSTFEEWKKEVKEKKLFQGPEFTHRRLETIFRTNMQNAFATGRYMEMTAPAVLKRRPYWRFSAVRDGRTTKVCAAAHGTILPANHPWWKTHIPPLHFNCRSTFVPMTEKDAKAAGITKTPTELNSALGFGNPPDGVPAAAKDMPTEEERQAAEKTAEEVQTAVEERQNASSELTTAKHEKTVADRKLKTAEKELIRAPQEEVPERRKDVEEAKKASKTAEKHVETAKKGLEKAEKHVEEVMAANENKPRSWTLVPERLKRLAKGVAKSAVSVMSTILGPFRKLKDAVVDEVPVLEGATRDGKKIFLKRGDKFRTNLTKNETKNIKKLRNERTVWPSREENPHPPTVEIKGFSKRHRSLEDMIDGYTKGRNTVKIGDFDLDSEIKQIIDGKVSEFIDSSGRRIYKIGKRTFSVHKSGEKNGVAQWVIYPLGGPGFDDIDGNVIGALKILKRLEDKSYDRSKVFAKFEEKHVDEALRLWKDYKEGKIK